MIDGDQSATYKPQDTRNSPRFALGLRRGAQPPSSNSHSLNEQPSEAFRKWIEMEVLKIMKELVGRKDVQSKRIQEIANRTLDLIKPGMTMGALFQAAIKLNDGYPELDPLVIKLMKEYEQKYKYKAIEQVTDLVENGKYDEAEDVVKKVLEFKMSE